MPCTSLAVCVKSLSSPAQSGLCGSSDSVCRLIDPGALPGYTVGPLAGELSRQGLAPNRCAPLADFT